jgi:hypothetical protein
MKKAFVSCAVLSTSLVTTKSFGWNLPTTHHSKASLLRLRSAQSANDGENKDLFDYFDPLLSPHAYPDGVAPDKKPSQPTKNSENTSNKSMFEMNVLGMDQPPLQAAVEEEEPAKEITSQTDDKEEDLFDYFDPLKSPHEYPNGISPRNQEETVQQSGSKQYSMNVLGMDYEAKPLEVVESDSQPKESSSGGGEGAQDLFDTFDPLKSPHEYPNGISPNNKATEVEDDRYNPLAFGKKNKKEKVEKRGGSGKLGILLMDHGSRNEASNKRLEHLAELYQMTMEGENIVVYAAHMEIASPSIPDGLERLLQEGVGTYHRFE